MLQRNKFLFTLLLLIAIAAPLVSWGADKMGVDFPTSAETGLSDKGIQDILVSILQWMLGVVGIVALIGFVISGAIYIFSAGEEKRAEKAKAAMTNSIIGIVVVLASFVVIKAIDAMLNGMSF